MHIFWTLDLNIRVGDLITEGTFAVFLNLAVPMIIGTAYQNQTIELIYRKKELIKLVGSRVIAFLDTFTAHTITAASVQTVLPEVLRVMRQIKIHLMAEMLVKVRCGAVNYA